VSSTIRQSTLRDSFNSWIRCSFIPAWVNDFVPDPNWSRIPMEWKAIHWVWIVFNHGILKIQIMRLEKPNNVLSYSHSIHRQYGWWIGICGYDRYFPIAYLCCCCCCCYLVRAICVFFVITICALLWSAAWSKVTFFGHPICLRKCLTKKKGTYRILYRTEKDMKISWQYY